MYPVWVQVEGWEEFYVREKWAGRACLKVAMAMKSCKSVEGLRTTSGPEWAVLDVGVFPRLE